MPSPSTCSVCHLHASKYKCPRCLARTCSAVCVSAHKKSSGCDGKRDRAKFVAMAEYDDNTLVSDYVFLEDGSRLVTSTSRNPLAHTNSFSSPSPFSPAPSSGTAHPRTRRKPPRSHVKLSTLVAAARAQGVELRIMPAGMSRRVRNQTGVRRVKSASAGGGGGGGGNTAAGVGDADVTMGDAQAQKTQPHKGHKGKSKGKTAPATRKNETTELLWTVEWVLTSTGEMVLQHGVVSTTPLVAAFARVQKHFSSLSAALLPSSSTPTSTSASNPPSLSTTPPSHPLTFLLPPAGATSPSCSPATHQPLVTLRRVPADTTLERALRGEVVVEFPRVYVWPLLAPVAPEIPVGTGEDVDVDVVEGKADVAQVQTLVHVVSQDGGKKVYTVVDKVLVSDPSTTATTTAAAGPAHSSSDVDDEEGDEGDDDAGADLPDVLTFTGGAGPDADTEVGDEGDGDEPEEEQEQGEVVEMDLRELGFDAEALVRAMEADFGGGGCGSGRVVT
ncbi:hypothetical protein M427DRAFT_37616 [Gonapodya prolifera JEL478]|uniref:HIT-type domain-containing protein n=1 Tax=Gonapodya prolifera (strain JEL478) TaxID=1344416 RepID=A0A139A146_GONPJ|nr:hypothetical protein M427DRAFT_37616 [Gonapodya prolifera JEL478]|eukprot:KXS10245.1 hypothetical protein M427DRAFT_37616 [Gonapodya prolifera JEL478]